MPPAALLAAGRHEVIGYGGEVVTATVADVIRCGGSTFQVRLVSGRRVSARPLLIATGLRDERPDVAGLRQRWARDVAYRKHLGVFYTTQDSIGQTMIRGDGRFATYREFCAMLVDPAEAVWLDRLVEFFLSCGRVEHMDRLEDALRAIEELLSVLDDAVGGGASLISAVRAESHGWGRGKPAWWRGGRLTGW